MARTADRSVDDYAHGANASDRPYGRHVLTLSDEALAVQRD
jgi:hypothetical protein